MSKIVLTRINPAPTYTLGFIRHKDFFCFTLEPGKGVGKGCIPCGVYPIVWEWSPKFKSELWELKNVPDFDEVKIHEGNIVENTLGCPLLGYRFFIDDHNAHLGYSANAVGDFNQLCHDERITEIEIKEI